MRQLDSSSLSSFQAQEAAIKCKSRVCRVSLRHNESKLRNLIAYSGLSICGSCSHCLFWRRLLSWNTNVVNQMVNGWKVDGSEPGECLAAVVVSGWTGGEWWFGAQRDMVPEGFIHPFQCFRTLTWCGWSRFEVGEDEKGHCGCLWLLQRVSSGPALAGGSGGSVGHLSSAVGGQSLCLQIILMVSCWSCPLH